MNYREYIKDLENGELKPVYVFYGTERYLIDFLIKKTKKKYVDKSFEALNYAYLDGEKVKFSEIENANETLPFMAEKKVVVVDNCDFLSKKGKDEASEGEEARFLEYVKSSNRMSVLVLTVDSEKLDNRRKLVKELKKYGGLVELNKLTDKELSSWINGRFKKAGKQIKGNVLEKFIEFTGYFEKDSGTDLISLENEISKLIDYLGTETAVSFEAVDRVTTKSIQSNIFRLVDLLGQKRLKESMDSLVKLLQAQIAPQMILHMISRQFRLIYMAHLYLEKGYSQSVIKEKIGIKHDFIINKLIAQSRNFDTESLEAVLKKCAALDEDLKLTRIEERLGLEKLLVEISGPK